MNNLITIVQGNITFRLNLNNITIIRTNSIGGTLTSCKINFIDEDALSLDGRAAVSFLEYFDKHSTILHCG